MKVEVVARFHSVIVVAAVCCISIVTSAQTGGRAGQEVAGSCCRGCGTASHSAGRHSLRRLYHEGSSRSLSSAGEWASGFDWLLRGCHRHVRF